MKTEYKFRDLSIGQTFDFISPQIGYNSYFLRCKKISQRCYVSEDGKKHQVGSTSCIVYHVEYELNS